MDSRCKEEGVGHAMACLSPMVASSLAYFLRPTDHCTGQAAWSVKLMSLAPFLERRFSGDGLQTVYLDELERICSSGHPAELAQRVVIMGRPR